MKKLSLVLDGMGCGACVANVRKTLDALPGVTIDDVAVGSASVTFDPDRHPQQTITDALAQAGYPVLAVSDPGPTTASARPGGCCGN